MGIIRKTASISTLGIVSFRSKKELLRRAEKDRLAAEAALSREQAARAEADRRVAAAEKRMQEALHMAREKAYAKAKRKAGTGKRRGRRQRPDRGAIEVLGDLIAAAQPVVEEQAKAAGRQARKAAKASRQAAERAQREASRGGRRARARLVEVEHAMAPRVGAAAERVQAVAAERVQAVKGDIADWTAAATDKLKERDEASRDGD